MIHNPQRKKTVLRRLGEAIDTAPKEFRDLVIDTKKVIEDLEGQLENPKMIMMTRERFTQLLAFEADMEKIQILLKRRFR